MLVTFERLGSQKCRDMALAVSMFREAQPPKSSGQAGSWRLQPVYRTYPV